LKPSRGPSEVITLSTCDSPINQCCDDRLSLSGTRASTTPRRSPTTTSCSRSGRWTSNALAESFVDSFKTELIADRVWRTRAQLELAVVEYIGWFNHSRLHSSLGDIPPVQFEALQAAKARISANRLLAALPPRAAAGPTEPQILLLSPANGQNGVDHAITTSMAAAGAALREPLKAPVDGPSRRRIAPLALRARCAHRRREGPDYYPVSSYEPTKPSLR
jgi:putative transposase